jgi:hypothetical protein
MEEKSCSFNKVSDVAILVPVCVENRICLQQLSKDILIYVTI